LAPVVTGRGVNSLIFMPSMVRQVTRPGRAGEVVTIRYDGMIEAMLAFRLAKTGI
jgi:hypothetical protein